jgi:hypothetical protein
MVVTLAILNGPRRQFSTPLASPGRYIIGSGEVADFRISDDDDPYVSGQHALIDVTRSYCTIQSLAGLNPLIVNGEHVREKRLSEGDVVQVGFTRIGVSTSIPCCYQCGKTDEALIESAESDGRFCEFREVAIHAHSACLSPDPQFASRKIAGFDVQRSLGHGGFGSVWLVHDLKTSRLWAIKQMRGMSGEDYSHRFRREGRFLVQFVHSRIARCVEVGEDPDAGSYLVCEFIPGQDLARFVREKGPQPPWWMIDVMIQVLAGLHFLHTRPGVIVHRDVKPDNVLLKLENVSGTAAPLAKLADFGISRALAGPGSTRLTKPGAVPGTFFYLAPEIFSGESYGPAADVYSVGVTAYYVLTGKHPYDFPREAGDAALLYHLLSNDPIPIQARLPGIPASVAAVIDKACTKDPRRRYPTALGLAEALIQARKGGAAVRG